MINMTTAKVSRTIAIRRVYLSLSLDVYCSNIFGFFDLAIIVFLTLDGLIGVRYYLTF